MEDPTFDRHGLTPITVLNQAMSGLAHLHSLNIGKMNFSFEDCVDKNEFYKRKLSGTQKRSRLSYHLPNIWDDFTFETFKGPRYLEYSKKKL